MSRIFSFNKFWPIFEGSKLLTELSGLELELFWIKKFEVLSSAIVKSGSLSARSCKAMIFLIFLVSFDLFVTQTSTLVILTGEFM